ncbi:putative Lipase [Seiridium cardinale]|uniref:Lipase n=1 Tax=Seiridium cardinale TaxID=138064 RepID=A0ABR2X691_9PEZI
MKPFTWTLISSYALSAAAGPIPDEMKLYLKERATTTVTMAEVTAFDFYAEYAAASYCNSDVAVGTVVTCADDACPDVTSAGAVVTATFAGDVTDIQGFVSIDDTNKVIVASFRGSHSVRNWITDLVFVQELCDITTGCLLHTGFYDAWLEVADNVTAAIAAAVATNPSYSIVFTGHSLGAAVGTVAAAYVRNAGYSIDIYTYGSPRVGNRPFVAYVTDQAGAEYRVTHLDDPVPRLPPIILNYRHTSPEYWLSDGTANTTEYTVSDVKVCEGYANLGCNAGTTGFDTDAHGYYFEAISGCSPDGTPLKRRDDSDLSDEDIEAQLNEYVVQDTTYVAHNLSGDVWA